MPRKRKRDPRAEMPADFIRVRALTLWRPWALAILAGPKRVENRPRGWNIQGDLLAIHNAQRFSDDAWRQIRHLWPEVIDVDEDLAERLDTPQAIVGVARVSRVMDRRDPAWEPFAIEHLGWCTGPVAIELERPVALETPIPWRGQQGLWNVGGAEAETLREAWKAGRDDDQEEDGFDDDEG